jgi:hypothetical protein
VTQPAKRCSRAAAKNCTFVTLLELHLFGTVFGPPYHQAAAVFP